MKSKSNKNLIRIWWLKFWGRKYYEIDVEWLKADEMLFYGHKIYRGRKQKG